MYWRYINIKGQGHYLTSAKGHSIFKFKSCFSSPQKTCWAIWNQVSCESFWEKWNKNYTTGLGHMTNITATPIYFKTFKILVLQNKLRDGLEHFKTVNIVEMVTFGRPRFFMARSNMKRSWNIRFHGKFYRFCPQNLVYTVAQMNTYGVLSTRGQSHSWSLNHILKT